MKQCDGFESIVVVQRFDAPYDTSNIANTERFESFLSASPPSPPPIARVDFQDPMIVYYSSGTTGTPKAIVHSVGPLLVSMHKEAVLHRDIDHEDVGLQYTTTGWIMYLSSVGRLVFGGRTIVYDGSPFMPDRTVLLRIADEQKATGLGVSPRWLGELMKHNVVPQKVADLRSLRFVGSTGMVLKEQVFHWFYDGAFPSSVRLANFSGGTDIVSLCLGVYICLRWVGFSLFSYLGRLLRHRKPSHAHLCRRVSRRQPRHTHRHLPSLIIRRRQQRYGHLACSRWYSRRPSGHIRIPKRALVPLERHLPGAGRKVPLGLLRTLPQRLGTGRLCGDPPDDAAHLHPRPVRRRAEPERGPVRQRGHLRGAGAVVCGRGGREPVCWAAQALGC